MSMVGGRRSFRREPERRDVAGGERRLRCLWLTRLDPRLPDAGDLIYSYHLLASLHNAGVAVTVLATARLPRDAENRARGDGIEWLLVSGRVESRLHSALRSLFSRLPNIAYRSRTRGFRRALEGQLAKDWDAIFIDHLGMGWAWPRIDAYRRRHPRAVSVFVTHNREAAVRRDMARNFTGNLLMKFGLHVDALKARRLEEDVVRNSTLFTVVAPEDRRGFGSLPKSVVILPGYEGRRLCSREITATTPRRALMLGTATWLAKQMNLSGFLDVADEIFSNNGIELWIVGRQAGHRRFRAAYRATRFLGFVHDLESVFRDARIGIIAERTGGGFKLKSLDFVFQRLPIAAVDGGLAGLPLVPNEDYLSFASLRELAEGVAGAIDDLDRLNVLQEAAYVKCSAGFDWAERGQSLLRAVQGALAEAGTGPHRL